MINTLFTVQTLYVCINVCARVHVCATLTMIVRQATAPVHVAPVAQLVVLVTSYTLHTHT